MAVPLTCSDCGGDGTRCRCNETRELRRRYKETVAERIRRNDAAVAEGLRKLRELHQFSLWRRPRGGGA